MANKKNKNTGADTKFGFSVIMGVFALVMLCIFPVVYHDFYFDILETKYQFYCISAISMIVLMAGYGLWTGVLIDGLKEFKLKDEIKKLSAADWAMIVFWFAHVVSWLLCDYRWEAFWGTSGRYNGVFLITIYMIVYFLVTRFFEFRKWYLDAFLAVSLFVCFFGITDFFKGDLLGFKVHMMDEQKSVYTSTFGNINTYTIYAGTVLCVAMMLFTQAKEIKHLIWYFVVMMLSAVALIMGNSDSAYLTLAALFGFSPLYLFRTKTGMRRYLASVAAFLTATVFVGWICETYAENVYGISGVFNLLVGFGALPGATAALWLVVGGWSVAFMKKKEEKKEEVSRVFVYAWMLVIAAVAAVVAYVLYDANIAGNAEKYAAVSRYVVFNDDWGTSRGWAWIRTMQLYNHILTVPQKMFGYGADTLQLLMMQYFPPKGNVVFDSVHNEYLHFLVTTGLVGMISYIVFLGASVIRMMKQMKDRPEVLTVMIVIAAYAVQAVVNINLPVVFPLIFQLLAMGLAKAPEKEK